MFTNITIKSRLISVLGLLSALLISIGALGLLGMSKANDGLQTVYVDRTVALGYISDIDTLISANRVAANNAALFPTEENISLRSRTIAENVEKVNQIWSKYIATFLSPQEKELAKQFEVDRQRFRDEALVPAMKLLRNKEIDAAREIIRVRFAALAQPVTDGLAALTKLQVDEAKFEYEQAMSRYESIRQATIAAVIAGLVIALWLGTILFRAIIHPLTEAQSVARKIAAGNFTSVIEIEHNDEAGEMLASLAQMQNNIKSFIAAHESVAQKHSYGFISEQMNPSQFSGSYAKLAHDTNQLLNSHIAVYQQMMEIVSQYARGNFDINMERLPGEKAKISTAMDSIKNTMLSFNSELSQLAEAGAKGDFSKRIDVKCYEFMFKKIAEDLNKFNESCEMSVHDILRVSNALAAGDLTQTITKNYPGLFGETQKSLNTTITNLANLIRQLKEAAKTIDSASKDIAAGNTNLSQRTEEQSVSLGETYQSMEELTSTVKQNSDNAQHANRLAAGASEIATKGGEVVERVVQTMSTITESSKKIVDIISVIDGIAFQTNILALNAAVEAARAGEQGRGFAVVATEVRNLAQRSAGAAKEIKELINDSVVNVEGGSRLVDEAGATMNEIVDAVKRVSDIIGEISVASQEQSTGIEQVSRTMAEMDELTQKNVVLVEQAATAAESMEEQALMLSEEINIFRLPKEIGQATTTPVKRSNRPAETKQPAPSPVVKKAATTTAATPQPRKVAAGGKDDWETF